MSWTFPLELCALRIQIHCPSNGQFHSSMSSCFLRGIRHSHYTKSNFIGNKIDDQNKLEFDWWTKFRMELVEIDILVNWMDTRRQPSIIVIDVIYFWLIFDRDVECDYVFGLNSRRFCVGGVNWLNLLFYAPIDIWIQHQFSSGLSSPFSVLFCFWLPAILAQLTSWWAFYCRKRWTNIAMHSSMNVGNFRYFNSLSRARFRRLPITLMIFLSLSIIGGIWNWYLRYVFVKIHCSRLVLWMLASVIELINGHRYFGICCQYGWKVNIERSPFLLQSKS